jgi:hypothetical protein
MRILVSNTAGQRVARGGLVFAPRENAREVVVTNTAYREIKACRALRILRSSTDDKTPFAQVDAGQTLSVNEEAFLRPERTRIPGTIEVMPGLPGEAVQLEPADLPPVVTRPRAVPEAKPPEAKKTAAKKTAKPLLCPHCDFIAKKKSGLTSHIKRHHPEASQ